jgi:phosphate-selective porin OprO/OprP
MLPPILAVPAACVLLQEPSAGTRQEEEHAATLEERVAELEARLAASEAGGWDIAWQDGLRFDSRDGLHSIQWGGLIHLDAGFYRGDDDYPGDLEDALGFRRLRLQTRGRVWGRVTFQLQLDFQNEDLLLRNAWIGLTGTPLGELRLGHQKEPFGLEWLTPSPNLTFTERGLTNAFAYVFDTGVLAHDAFAAERATWALGVFRPSDDRGLSRGEGDATWVGRATWLPLCDDGGRDLVHVGAAVKLQGDDDGRIAYSSSPETSFVGQVASVELTDADGATLLGAEAAWVRGPFSLQGEYMLSVVERPGANPGYSAFYVYGSWFPSGESRVYDRCLGVFGRLVPQSPFGAGGSGAWEVAARYSALDLSDPNGPSTDELSDVTLGLSWYLDRNARVMADWVHSLYRSSAAEADAELLTLRLQLDF